MVDVPVFVELVKGAVTLDELPVVMGGEVDPLGPEVLARLLLVVVEDVSEDSVDELALSVLVLDSKVLVLCSLLVSSLEEDPIVDVTRVLVSVS